MKPRITPRITRDSILFLFGMAGIVHETVVAGGDRPTLLVLFGACIGLPAFLRSDEKSATKLEDAVTGEVAAKARSVVAEETVAAANATGDEQLAVARLAAARAELAVLEAEAARRQGDAS